MNAKNWFDDCWQWKLGSCTAFIGALSVTVSQGALAQIVPDNTLGSEASVVTPNVTIRGIDSDRIEGGAIRGTNLFHSFSQLNIAAGRGAYFTNPVGITNILSRVTGANRSEILGRLGVLGDANLFLINPNGIVFGSAASLDVKGSFLATTANAVRLGDTGLFSASQPATSNLLSVSPSAFWFNAVAAQPIVNQSQSTFGQPNSAGRAPGLQVQPNRTIALLGGDVLLEGGNLTAAGGRIELGSVTGIGQVSLTQNGDRFAFGYDSIQNFGTLRSSSPFGVVALSDRAFVDASGEGGGDIQIRAARLAVSQASNIWSDSLGTRNGGTVLIRTAEMDLSERSILSADVSRSGIGTGGTIAIDTGRLQVQTGAQIVTTTRGAGKGGNLQIAADTIEMNGTSADGQSPSSLLAQSRGSGDAGEIRIDTQRLVVQDGAQIVVTTRSTGKGGNLQLEADTIDISGRSANGRFGSGLFTQIAGSGDAGNLRINTRRLTVSDGGQVSASTSGAGKGGSLQVNATEFVELIGRSVNFPFSSSLSVQTDSTGDAGNLRIDTQRLILRNGALLSAGTRLSGKGGNLQINATDSVELSGRSPDNRLPSRILAPSEGSGDAGDIRIDTQRLLLRDGGGFSSGSRGEGNAGNINIIARDVLRSEDGKIQTQSSRSAGGAITINAGAIRLFGDADIRSEVASGANNGGNITLTANSIVSFNDSDIFAFARDGRGGDIALNTPAFFGENYRSAAPGTNPDTLDFNNRVDINATGAINGIITLPDVSFIQNSLSDLPDNVINTDTLLASSCIMRRNQLTQGNFTVTGTGGLPQRPGESQTSSFPTVDVETLPNDSASTSNRIWRKGDRIVEPQGIYRLPNGKIVLSRNCPNQ